LNAWIAATSLWAQVGSPSGGPGTAPSGAGSGSSISILAIRRWYAGLTLATPANPPGLAWFWALPLGLLGLVLLVAVIQGPGRTLRQLFDIPGHLRLFSAAMARLRRSGRLLAVVVGVTVVTWTVNQTLSYADAQGREDLTALTKGRQVLSLALEQGALAGATPLRDLIGLGNMIPLLIASAVLVFQFSTDRWGSVSRVISARASRDAAWGTLVWGATALYAVYRAIGVIYGSPDLPLTGCFGVEVVVVPLLMPLADGMLIAWVVVELRNAGLADSAEAEALDVPGAVALMPAAAVTCLLLMPGRYIATAVALAFQYFPTLAAGSWWTQSVRWLLGWGVIDLQAAAIPAIGLVGALAWCRGTVGSLLSGFRRLLRHEGGHVVGFLISCALMAAGLAMGAYILVLSLPIQTWVLGAADSYAHYATLPIGLLLVAGLVELAERSLPVAVLSAANVNDPVRVVAE
jgi:hypothetical protein